MHKLNLSKAEMRTDTVQSYYGLMLEMLNEVPGKELGGVPFIA